MVGCEGREIIYYMGAKKDAGEDDVFQNKIEPIYYSKDKIKMKNELVFLRAKDRSTDEIKNFFAIGYDSHSYGPWDGVSGENQCYKDSTGKAYGYYDNAEELNLLAAQCGANFVYVWSGEDRLSTTPKLYGRWLEQYNSMNEIEWKSIPIIYNGVDMVSNREKSISELREKFMKFKLRVGEYSLKSPPKLPSYEIMPWFAWHPTWRIKGTGTERGEMTTSEEADAFAQSTTMMIGDSYTYVENRFDEEFNPITGQRGKRERIMITG